MTKSVKRLIKISSICVHVFCVSLCFNYRNWRIKSYPLVNQFQPTPPPYSSIASVALEPQREKAKEMVMRFERSEMEFFQSLAQKLQFGNTSNRSHTDYSNRITLVNPLTGGSRKIAIVCKQQHLNTAILKTCT